MNCQFFVPIEDLVRSHQENIYRTAQDVHWGRVYSGRQTLLDRLLAHTGDGLIRLGTYLKTEHSVPSALRSSLDSCEVEA